MKDFGFVLTIVFLMLMFWGEPDLFDAVRAYLMRSLQ